MTGKTRHAPPRAGAMLEALRGLGYSTGFPLGGGVENGGFPGGVGGRGALR